MVNIPLKNSILSWIMKKRIHQIDLFMRYPHEVQKEVFSHLIEKGKYSLFGKEHNFKEITSYSGFCHHIPIRTYEELFPYIDKLRKGENDVLWPGKIKWFAKSSGTTNDRSKYIPISTDQLSQNLTSQFEHNIEVLKKKMSKLDTESSEVNVWNIKGYQAMIDYQASKKRAMNFNTMMYFTKFLAPGLRVPQKSHRTIRQLLCAMEHRIFVAALLLHVLKDQGNRRARAQALLAFHEDS